MPWPFTSPRYSSADGSCIDCVITHPDLGAIEYTASVNDPDPNSPVMHAHILASAEAIGAYVPPAPAPAPAPAVVMTTGTAPAEVG